MCLHSLISDASEWLFQLCHEHSSDSPHQGNHPRRAPHLLSKPLFTLPPFYVNKSTLRGICLSSPCCVILPPRHSGGEYGHVKRKLSPTSDLQFLTPPLFICVSRKAFTPPLKMEELLRQLTDISLRQHQIVEHLATRQGQADQEIAALRTAARQRVPLRIHGTSHPAPAKNDRPWRCGGLLANVWEYDYHRGMGPGRLGPCTGPSPHGRIPACILQPPNYNGGEIWGCKEGNSGPSGAISSVRDPVFPWLDVPASTSRSGPSRWTYSSGTSLADGWNTHGCPGNGTRGDRSPPPGPAPCFPPGGRHAEPHNHVGASGGNWAGWGGPPTWGWGASNAFSLEGGSGATRAGGHLVADRQDGGPRASRWVNANSALLKWTRHFKPQEKKVEAIRPTTQHEDSGTSVPRVGGLLPLLHPQLFLLSRPLDRPSQEGAFCCRRTRPRQGWEPSCPKFRKVRNTLSCLSAGSWRRLRGTTLPWRKRLWP